MSVGVLMRLVVYGLVLLLVSRAVDLGARVAPLGAARRRDLLKALPLVNLLLGVIFLAAAVGELFDGWPEAVGLLGIVFGGLWLARFALMDAITGALLRVGGLTRGDRIQLDGLEGRVVHLGVRALTVETRGGDEALIPYSLLGRQAVIRSAGLQGVHRHTFRLDETLDPERIRRLVLLCHWSAVARPPLIECEADGSVQVTVYALAPDMGAEIEAFVRRSLASEPPDAATG